MNDPHDTMVKKRLKVVASKSIETHQGRLGIVTLHQVAEIILNLALPITNFTSSPEKYCKLWHEEIGNDIKGLKDMLAVLERTYARVDVALHSDQLK